MSDSRLRAAERALAADPSPEAQAVLLCERLRAGLDPGRVELAAYAGHEGARLAIGWERPSNCDCLAMSAVLGDAVEYHREESWDPASGLTASDRHYTWCPGSRRYRHPQDTARFSHWLRGLSRWGAEAQVRAAIAAARVALPVWEHADAGQTEGGYRLEVENIDMQGGTAPRRAIEAAEAWVACQCEEHIQAWRTTCSLVAMGRHPWLPHALTADSPERAASLVGSIAAAARLAGEAPVREGIQRALIEWSLA